MIFDVSGSTQEVTEIRWSIEAEADDQSYNLIKRHGGVTFKQAGLNDLQAGNASLCESKEEALSLIKGLQKAIDLGWLR